MNKVWVCLPKRGPAFRLSCFLVGIYIFNKYAEYSFRKEFMKRVRARNELLRLDTGALKELVEVDLLNLAGQRLKFSDLEGDYLCVYIGQFKNFLRVNSAMLATPFESQITYLYITDETKLKRLTNEAMRAPIKDT